MAASEKREYKSEASAKRQLVQWQKKGGRVTRRKNALYIQKTWRKGKGDREVDMRMTAPSRLGRKSSSRDP